jgi:hypothetical protein
MPTSTTTPPTAAFQDAVVTSIKQSQKLALDGVTAWADLAGKAFKSAPAFNSLPVVDFVPDARELVDASFGLAEELLAVQKEFSTKLFDAVAKSAR